MLGIHAKRGVEATFERIFSASGGKLPALNVVWSGKSASICHEDGRLECLTLPNIDETADITKTEFNNLIAFALHELGHLWYTKNKYWKRESRVRGKFFHSLVNGLEDPRIEKNVIEAGLAGNARSLFENLVNDMLMRDGYVQPNDRKNIPFMLAIEGRRLNGYNICAASILDRSKYGEVLKEALSRKCASTDNVVDVAIWLYAKLNEIDEQTREGDDPERQGDEGNQEKKQGDETNESGKGDSEKQDSQARDVEPHLDMKSKTNSKNTPMVGGFEIVEIK